MKFKCGKCSTAIEAELRDAPAVLQCQTCSAVLILPARRSDGSGQPLPSADEIKAGLKAEILAEIRPSCSQDLQALRTEVAAKLAALEARMAGTGGAPVDEEALLSRLQARLSAALPKSESEAEIPAVATPVTVCADLQPVEPKDILAKIKDEPTRNFVESNLPEKKIYLIAESGTKVDTGGWLDKHAWVMLAEDSLLICAPGKKEFRADIPLADLTTSIWNGFTRELVLSPAKNAPIKAVRLQRDQAELILAAIGRVESSK